MTPTFASVAIVLTLLAPDSLSGEASRASADQARGAIVPSVDVRAPESWGNADEGLRYLAKLFRWVKKSKFLTGQSPAGPGRQPFTLDLEWLLNATNWL